MINLFHILFYASRFILKTFKKRLISGADLINFYHRTVNDNNPQFVYSQTVSIIQDYLLKNKWPIIIKNAVIVGCGDVKKNQLLTSVSLQELILIGLIKDLKKHAVYICHETNVYNSIKELNERLIATDVVFCINVFEYFAYDKCILIDIFNVVHPKLVVLSSVNTLNDDLHTTYLCKSKQNFIDWVKNAMEEFQDYSVVFNDVYLNEFNLQIAICLLVNVDDIEGGNLQESQVEPNSQKDDIIHEISYHISNIGTTDSCYFNDEKERSEIPLRKIASIMCTSSEILELILTGTDWQIEGCVSSDNIFEKCVIYEPQLFTTSADSNESICNTDLCSSIETSEKVDFSDWEATPSEEKDISSFIDDMEDDFFNIRLRKTTTSSLNSSCSIETDKSILSQTNGVHKNKYSSVVDDLIKNNFQPVIESISVYVLSKTEKDNMAKSKLVRMNSPSTSVKEEPASEPSLNLSDLVRDFQHMTINSPESIEANKQSQIKSSQKIESAQAETDRASLCSEHLSITSEEEQNDQLFDSGYQKSIVEMSPQSPEYNVADEFDDKSEMERLELNGPLSVIDSDQNEEKPREVEEVVLPIMDELAAAVIVPVPPENPDVVFRGPIVENGDLINNNRDYEGNNYEEQVPAVAENDNENFPQQDIDELDAHNENHIVLGEENEEVFHIHENPEVEDLGRPENKLNILVQPISELSLSSMDVNTSADSLDIPITSNTSEEDIDLPVDPFPNWLLLILNNTEPVNNIDYLSQGDNLSVNPIEPHHTSSSSDDSDDENEDDDLALRVPIENPAVNADPSDEGIDVSEVYFDSVEDLSVDRWDREPN